MDYLAKMFHVYGTEACAARLTTLTGRGEANRGLKGRGCSADIQQTLAISREERVQFTTAVRPLGGLGRPQSHFGTGTLRGLTFSSPELGRLSEFPLTRPL